jgi:protein-S-isoprenylcysteine O-methyltransferase Ste14
MTDTTWSDLTQLLCFWLAYFALHSFLASLGAKRFVAASYPSFMPFYRIVYNALAALLILPILWFSYLHPGPMLWQWQGGGALLANGLALLSCLGFIRSLKYYDTQEFIGFSQLRNKTQKVEDQEHFQLSPFHRFVRHPWYFFGLILIWTRDLNAAMLLSGSVITLYIIVGSRLEEQKLLIYHGEIYRRYLARVPGLFPLPWKFLSTAEAQELAHKAQGCAARQTCSTH